MTSEAQSDPSSKEFTPYRTPIVNSATWSDYLENLPGSSPEVEYFNAVASHIGAVDRLIDHSETQGQTLDEFKQELRFFLQERKEFIKFVYEFKP